MLTLINNDNVTLVKMLLREYSTIPPILTLSEYNFYLKQADRMIACTSENPNDPALVMCHALGLRLEEFEELFEAALVANEEQTFNGLPSKH